MSIEILSQDVINQIAAGEVVERPSHLVKELLENSIDAGATQIQIDVNFGGKFIKISDNGSGINKKDLALALVRHATSKIHKTDDLWNLNSYGFRGEALASISAVSKLTLQSKTKDDKKAYQIKSEFGQISDIMDSSIDHGTQITIESLFENVPARLKFLKTDATELSQIRQVVKALSLVYSNVEFKMIENGKLDLLLPVSKGTDFSLDRVIQVLGLKKIYVHTYQNPNFKVKAYFSSPHDTQKTAKNIWIFAQKRWIQDRALQAALMDSYRSLLMHGEYPNVVIDLECNPEIIDVNIHPTKSQVKFQNSSEAYKAVHAVVRQGLESAPWLESKLDLEAHYYKPTSPTSTAQMTLHDENKIHEFGNTQFKTKSLFNSFDSDQTPQINIKDQLSRLRVDVSQLTDQHAQAKPAFWSSLQVIGQLNLTYIVCQKNDRMILVDQHAAHERVAFEKLMRKWKGGLIDQQDYLFPLAIDLSVEKVEALGYIEKDIQKMGLEFEILGPTVIGVKSAPLFIKETALPKMFEKLAHDLLEYGGSYSLEKSIADLFATMACHSVVRAGQSLSQIEMTELLNSMDEFPLSSFCPHGRPVSIEFPFHEIERNFGRIV